MKLHKTLFYLLILFLPTQLGKHFWPDWAMVYGLRLDYLSPTLYFTDIIILAILILWGVEKLLIYKTNKTGYSMVRWLYKFATLFFIFLVINCFLAQNQPAAFYKLAKITELVLLGLYVAKNQFNSLYSNHGRGLNCDRSFLCLEIAVVYSSLLAILQFLKQGSLGGLFYFLGERSFTGGTPGIAQTIWQGQLLLRPYATFPHPNVLAGFLVISLLLMTQFPISNFQFPMKSQFLKCSKLIRILAIILGTVALFLTFSHVAWVVFVLGVLVLILFRHCEPRPWRGVAISRLLRHFIPRNDVLKLIGSLVILVFIGSLGLYFAPIQSESITYRQDLNLAAIKEWQSSPLIGVGLNNFLIRLPEFYESSGEIRWFQPAHNIFLMVLAETGVIGLIGVIGFLILTYKRLFNCLIAKLLIPLTAILVLGLFDHYFYTLQQGQLLLTIVLGMTWSKFIQPSKDAVAH